MPARRRSDDAAAPSPRPTPTEPSAAEATPPQAGRRGGLGRRFGGAILIGTTFLGGLALLGADYWFGLPPTAKATLVGRQGCVQCHAPQALEFSGSHHDRAMEVATAESVEGNFADASFEHYGIVTKMFTRDGKYWTRTEGPSGQMQEFEIKYTFGVKPLQQYLVELDGGRLQALDVAWDTEKKQWFLLDVEKRKQPPGDVLHWTGRGMNWNQMCADCHSTGVTRGFSTKDNAFRTKFHEVDVSCEACHGPGSLHVELAGAWSPFWDRVHGKGLVKLKGDDPTTQLETCAPCHSRRYEVYPGFEAGRPLLDHFVPELLDSDIYHPDGQIRPEHEGFEHGSFLMSKMYRKGVRCTDCHNPHSGKLHAQGNQLCAKCHQPAKFDTPAHHFHKEGTKGASCVECHMPESIYMEVDPRRDHSIRIPRPDLSVKLGTPNACNRCHTKPQETAAWAADEIAKRYPNPPRKPHFGETIAAGRKGEPQAEAGLRKLAAVKSEDDVGPVVRASALALLGQHFASPEADRAIADGLKDAEGLVRFAAVAAAEGRSLAAAEVAPLLQDPLRAVRIRAAQVFLGRPDGEVPSAWRQAFERAIEEFRTGLEANLDQGGTHFGLGLLALRGRDMAAAESSFRLAVGRDPLHQRAREQLAALLAEQNRLPEAEALLREGIAAAPKEAEMRFSLAKLLATMPGRAAEAERELETAVALDPKGARYFYNLGLLRQFRQAYPEAEAAFRTAAELDPRSQDYPYALALLLFERGDVRGAEKIAEELARLHPREAAYRLLWGRAMFRNGSTEAAERVLLQVQADLPDRPEVPHELALVYEQLGRRPEAIRYARQAAELGRGAPEFVRTLQRLTQGP